MKAAEKKLQKHRPVVPLHYTVFILYEYSSFFSYQVEEK